MAVAPYCSLEGQVGLEGLNRALGLAFLAEREQSVHDDDPNDRSREH
jgi:hypothetical protein